MPGAPFYLGRERIMSWKTIYITGKTDFRADVRRKLEHSDQRCMPGFIENSPGPVKHDLYWLDGKTNLRTFKEAIGGKLIWKYRLRFFTSLEAFVAAQQAKPGNEFSDREQEMMDEMRKAS